MAKKPSFPSRSCPKCGKPIHIKTKRHEECGWTANGAVSAKAEPAAASADGGEESTAGYFKRIFRQFPRLLGERSNAKLLGQWLADHPDHSEVPDNVKANLSNVKSVLRSKRRTKVAKRAQPAQSNGVAVQTVAPVVRKPLGSSKLDELELQIDECLILARHLDRDGLHDVITLLRRARNAVVWMIGQ